MELAGLQHCSPHLVIICVSQPAGKRTLRVNINPPLIDQVNARKPGP